MTTQANPFPLRLDDIVLEKIKIIAKENGRSANKEIEFVLKRAISAYEEEHGEITFSE